MEPIRNFSVGTRVCLSTKGKVLKDPGLSQLAPGTHVIIDDNEREDGVLVHLDIVEDEHYLLSDETQAEDAPLVPTS